MRVRNSIWARPSRSVKILYEVKQIPVVRKTPKGQPSTAEDVLEQLAMDHALPKLILKYRSLSKLKSTYTDKLPLQIKRGYRSCAYFLSSGGSIDGQIVFS